MILGIESTAHTLSFGVVDNDGRAKPSVSNLFRPEEGGIHPREAADHHSDVAGELLSEVMVNNSISKSDITAIAFSQGPGLGPCLRVGASVARALANSWEVPLIGVNHCVAHIEIGRNQTGCEDPVLLYVSGGNTQVIARRGNRYRVLGETLDIGIGNMLDKFARSQGIPFPGGPEIERLAGNWLSRNNECSLESILLPYGVQGMDLGFSGILTAAIKKTSSHELSEVCWSLQEHSFAACIEVAERAMAHTGKSELLLGGGVACNERLREMASIMCQERGGRSYSPNKGYCIDNGTMIAELGRKMLESGSQTALQDSAVSPGLRTDQTVVTWH
ncbi:MAG TPA: bifunctional N(6)-L-threonylcarbamoyladenine synthase/serine/threonine protein kinase [Candidatus Thalassarchaeum sp.]|jgi:universal protein Kae1|nr:bifunctional N(6)-L-threonylcarbamoyladenine synthase/serine/threonine protein kinase [Candidatus Thalassarchaeum sp.]|tara:strand:- start:15875 stop:16873 length:999 start_codon:yes stop_codon:yes gene_type:complete